MKLIDDLRNVFRVRKERQLPPPSSKPPVGSNIVMLSLRMRLLNPITNEQWAWLTSMGWRTVNMRSDRRKYTTVSEQYVKRLLDADEDERYQLHRRLIASIGIEDSETRH